MSRWKRLSSKRLLATTIVFLGSALGGLASCEVLSQVDRSQIPTGIGGGGGKGGEGGNGGTGGAACTPVDDNNACTFDECDGSGNPVHTPVAAGTACSSNDGTLCDGNGACVECLAPTDCQGMDDACQTRTCTMGVCGFDYTAKDTPVPTQTMGDCKLKVCDGNGMQVDNNDDNDVPDDSNACTADTCDMGTPSHMNLAQGTNCGMNGNGDPLVCNDMAQCVGCNTAADCPGIDDECSTRTCDTAGVCGVNFTAKDTPVNAQTDNDCLQHVCDGNGKQIDIADDTDLPLDDGNACTGETCSMGTPGHPNVANGSACSDGDFCTLADTCQMGTCTAGTPMTCTASDACHVAGTCDPMTGMCSNPQANDGTTCDDNNPCTQTDICTTGACTGTNPIQCTASDACHIAGTCDPMTGMCSNPQANDGTACNDSNPCTQTDTCTAGNCTGSNPVQCSPSDSCHVVGTCNQSTGMCSNPQATDGTVCTSNMAMGTCAMGTCIACGDGIKTAAEACDDGNTTPGDGCNATCAVETGFTCMGTAPTVCTPICGNGAIHGTETCDDGNMTNGDGCSSTCQIEITCGAGEQLVVRRNATAFPIPDFNPAGILSPVNIGVTGGVTKAVVVVHSLSHGYLADVDMYLRSPQNVEREVTTDNGGLSTLGYVNTTFNDSATTLISAGAALPPYSGVFKPEQSLSATITTDFLGLNANGTWNLHVADDANLDTGTLNSWSLALCINPAAYCGNNTVDPGEMCDDGNTNDTDACNNLCHIQCGDGNFDAGEQCDDGNNVSNDGCSATCQVELTCPAGQTPVLLTNSTSAPITDNNTFINFPVNVTTAGGVKKVIAVVGSIDHTNTAEVDIDLQSPAGTVRVLSDDNGTAANYFNTFFDDAAATAVTAGTNPFNGHFKPEQTISTTAGTDFTGQNAIGTWNLQVRDDTSGTTGTFNTWTLGLCLDTAVFCGNGTIDAGEECDDANTNNADACNNSCQINDGCGDGNIDAGEYCDDNNIASGDGCSSTCQVEITCAAGQTPVIVNSTAGGPIADNNTFVNFPLSVGTGGGVKKVIAVLGSITHASTPQLDISLQSPGGTIRNLTDDNGTGANYISTFLDDAAATSVTAGAAPFSGKFRPEQSMSTTIGSDYTGQNALGTWNLQVRDDTAGTAGTVDSWTLALCLDTAVFCGNGTIDAGEECDDANSNNGDACSNSCQLNDGCGDGNIDAGEACDDNNIVSGDGCSSTCQPDISCGAGEVQVILTDNAAVAIPETAQGVVRPLNVAQTGVVRKAIATLNVAHGNTAHLDVFLAAPFAVEHELSTDNGSGANFAGTTFSDAAATAITSGASPFTGTFKAEQTLSDAAGFGNQTAAGDWKLRIADDTTGTTGTLNSWTIALCIDPSVSSICGNGIIEAGETCDDGNMTSGDGCASCQLEITCGSGQTLIVQKNTDGPIAIPDNNVTGNSSVINIATTGTVNKAVVVLDAISHTYDGDLALTLISPAATTVDLTSNNGSLNDHYISTVLSDSATTNVTAGAPPFRGYFKPEGPLSAVNNQASNGMWMLKGVDNANGDIGAISHWTLALCITP